MNWVHFKYFSFSGIVSLVLFLIMYIPAHAQTESATLRILAITEEEGTPVIGATVMLTIPDADTLHAGVTDADGFHEFSGITPRTYRIHISYIGFETYRERITLELGETRVYQPELARSTEKLGELTIQARGGSVRREAGRQTITAEQINRIPTPGPGGDLTMYLQTQPGVVTSGDRGGELYIRGGTPPQNLITVDKLPVIKPFHISNLFSAFPQEIISRVDFYAGGFGAEYTGATSAVMDVNLRQGNMRGFEAEAAASPYILSFQAEGPLKQDEQSLLFMGRTSLLEQTGPTLTGRDVPLKFYDLTARYSINWEGITCSITGLHTYDRGKINPDRDVELTWDNLAVGTRCLGYAEDLNQAFEFTIGYSGYDSSEDGFDDTVRESGLNMGFLRFDNSWNLMGLPVNYGAQFDITHYSALLEDPFAERNEQGEPRFPQLDSELDEITSTVSGYLYADWQPSESLTITPGIASQMRLKTVEPTLEPRLRVSWNPGGSEKQEFNLAVGRYIQVREGITDERDAGTVFYVYKPVGPEDPLPESLHGILGWRREFSDHLETSLEGYAKRQKHTPVAQWTREPGNTLNTALADGLTYGVDLQVELDWYPLFITLGYGLAEVTYEADSDDLVAWIDRETFRYNPSHDRRHQFNLTAGYQLAGFNIGLNWQYSSGNPYTQLFALDMILDVSTQHPLQDRGNVVSLYSEPFDARFPSFHRLDVSIAKTIDITPSLSLKTKIGAVNAYNIQNIFYFDVNTLQQVNELPFLPYFSLSTRVRSGR